VRNWCRKGWNWVEKLGYYNFNEHNHAISHMAKGSLFHNPKGLFWITIAPMYGIKWTTLESKWIRYEHQWKVIHFCFDHLLCVLFHQKWVDQNTCEIFSNLLFFNKRNCEFNLSKYMHVLWQKEQHWVILPYTKNSFLEASIGFHSQDTHIEPSLHPHLFTDSDN